MQTWSSLAHCSFDRADEKIGELITHLQTHTCISYGAFENDKIIGYIWAYPHPFRDETRMYISELSVKKDHRRQGVGTALMNLVETRAREEGFPALYLHAEAGSAEATRFYEAAGYMPERIQFRKEIAAGQ